MTSYVEHIHTYIHTNVSKKVKSVLQFPTRITGCRRPFVSNCWSWHTWNKEWWLIVSIKRIFRILERIRKQKSFKVQCQEFLIIFMFMFALIGEYIFHMKFNYTKGYTHISTNFISTNLLNECFTLTAHYWSLFFILFIG